MNVREQYNDVMAKARTLAEQATGRDFTETEQAVALELQRQAGELDARVKSFEQAEAVRVAMAKLGEQIGMTPDNGASNAAKAEPTRPVHPRIKASGGPGNWAKAVLKQHTDAFGGYKSILANGAVPVSVPLAPEPVRLGEPVLALRQVIPTIADAVGRWSFMRQTVRTSAAAVVPHGTRKPQSTYTLERVDGRSVTIAHLSEPLHRQDLDDAPLLEQFIDTEMRLGLEETLEDEIINGNGTGDHFAGLANVSGSQAQAWSTSLMETTRKAITKLEVLSLAPTAFVFSPADWEAIELLAADEANYTLNTATAAVPVDRAARRLWGVPVVVTTALTAGVGYLADFAGSTELHIREEARLDWSEHLHRADLFGAGEDGNLFEANMIQFRCEMRAGFAVTRPAGVVELDLSSAA